MTTKHMGHTQPTEYTIKHNQQVLAELPKNDNRDFEEANRGLIASDPELVVRRTDNSVIWDQTAYRFIEGDAPDTVNPSLWRQAKLNNIHGLFEVVPGIYQLRGFDLANLTIIEGKTGWIIVDPLTCEETARAALEFAKQHLKEKPISAIVITHSHIDHYGGIAAIISAEKANKDRIRIVAPEKFMEESISETVIAGLATRRRSQYMYGSWLEESPRGHVDTGLGKHPAIGKVGILAPTDFIKDTPQELEIDGLRFIFQNAPESEAVAELTFYLPEFKVYCGAEIVSRNLHNVYTLRGTKARNALLWSQYINEAMDLFDEAEVYFGTHHWPVWGREAVHDFLKVQRDSYKYIHDQTLRLANAGLTPKEISEQLQFPESLRQTFSNRDYYGTVRHNAKAVYTYYYGWYDANPANLNPLPPEESAKQYITYMGGADEVLEKAQASFDMGEYRWVSEVLNHLVFAEPENTKAKELLATAYDQLGYQAESGPWRDVYLTAALELRHGLSKASLPLANGLNLVKQMPITGFFDIMSVRLDGPAADGVCLTINFIFPDRDECYVLRLENSVLHYTQSQPDPNANTSLTMTHELYIRIFTRQTTMIEAAEKGDLTIDGSTDDLVRFFSLFPQPVSTFNIVTP
jgi:linear primary-alkylsulfatase